jgi:naphthalene 1,2-dioxygenase ferredoxin reductase component
MPQVAIEQWPHAFELGRKRILEAALDAGVPFPHGCGTGECGSCKCRVLAGEVQMDAHSSEALSPAERADGLILACRARAKGDVRLVWLDEQAPPLPVARMKCRVSGLQRLAHDVMALHLALPPDAAFSHHPGQFVRLRFGKLPERSYSMAGLSDQGELVFHVRVVPQGAVSPHVASSLQLGDVVEVHGPFGDAYWKGCDSPRLLLLGGGTGLAPVLSVLDAAIRDGFPADRIDLYHGVRTPADLYLGQALQQRAQAQGFRFVPTFLDASALPAAGHGIANARVGHLHEVVAADYSELQHVTIHAAGPPPMVEAVKALATARGCAAHRVLVDAFHAAPPAPKTFWARLTGRGGRA